jgi:predicted DsbA family dithiol-disulfide isomerase/uncharacterized membrane protein
MPVPPLAPSTSATRKLSVAAVATAIVGLAASVASLVDYVGASPAFCAETGCATVRESAWSHPLGVPMPLLGVAFFAAAIALGFVEAPRLRKTLAGLGALWAVLLLGMQAFTIGAWCKLCVVADLAAIGYAVTALAGAAALRFSIWRGAALISWLAAAIAILALWTHTPPGAAPPPSSGLPGFVDAAQAPGAATVVEVVDFECPWCRRMQQRLDAAIHQVGVPVRVVRKMFPLPGHPNAIPAALAYCCADAQGKGDAMAAALFAAPTDDLTPDGCERLALGVGCDLERYRRDLGAAAVRVAAETAEVTAAGVHSLPTLFIAGERIVGAAKSADELTELLRRAAR